MRRSARSRCWYAYQTKGVTLVLTAEQLVKQLFVTPQGDAVEEKSGGIARNISDDHSAIFQLPIPQCTPNYFWFSVPEFD